MASLSSKFSNLNIVAKITTTLYSFDLSQMETFLHLDYNCIALTMVQIKKVKPHMLIGLSGVGGVFNEEVDSKFLEFSNCMSHAPGIVFAVSVCVFTCI